MKSKYKVLLTCAFGEYMTGTIKALRNNEDGVEFEIIGADMKMFDTPFTGADKYYQVPRIDNSGYVQALLDICQKENIDVLICTSSGELEKVRMHHSDFEGAGTKVMVSEGGINVANDKSMANYFFEMNGYNVPLTIRSKYEVDPILASHPEMQFCLKQRFGCGSNGFRRIERWEIPILASRPGFWNEYLVQEYIDGKEYSIDLLTNKGNTVCGLVRETKHIDNGVPQHCVVCENPYVMELCQKVSKDLMFTGNIGYDVKVDEKTGKPFILDINPRYTATISLSWKAGMNLAYLGFKQFLGEEIDGTAYHAKTGTTLIRRRDDYFFDA